MYRDVAIPGRALLQFLIRQNDLLRRIERRVMWPPSTRIETMSNFSAITTGGYIDNELGSGGSWPTGTEALAFTLDPGRWVLYGMFNYDTELGSASNWFKVGVKISWQGGGASGEDFVYGGGNQARYGTGSPSQVQTVTSAVEIISDGQISVSVNLVSGVQSLGGDDAQTTPLYLSIVAYPG